MSTSTPPSNLLSQTSDGDVSSTTTSAVQVAVRIRPLSSDEISSSSTYAINVVDGEPQVNTYSTKIC